MILFHIHLTDTVEVEKMPELLLSGSKNNFSLFNYFLSMEGKWESVFTQQAVKFFFTIPFPW